MIHSSRPDEACSLLAEHTLDVVDVRDRSEWSSRGTRAWASAGLPLVKD